METVGILFLRQLSVSLKSRGEGGDEMPIEKYPYKRGDEICRDAYYRLPKYLFEYESLSGLSIEAKVLYARFLELLELSARCGWYDDEGRLYIRFTIKNVETFFKCSNHKAREIFKELGESGAGLITRMEQERGRPAIIYVHKFVKDDADHREVCKKSYAQKDREGAQKNYEDAQKNRDSAQKNCEHTPKRTANNIYINKIIKEKEYNKGFRKMNPYNYSTDDYEEIYSEKGDSL